ncbi:MAG: glycosyltransferase [Nitrospirae bacterium]|nr:glycosyltransferase [Nitrospirota bacterium]
MKIAILGTKGIPCRYGGMEMCAQEVSARLVARGHEVTVFCDRSLYPDRPQEHLGVRLRHMPSIPTKHLHILSATVLALPHVVREKPDAVLLFNVAHAPLILLLNAFGIPVVTNVGGMDWLRAKWGPTSKAYYRWSARSCAKWSQVLVCDSKVLADYYRSTYFADSSYIPYGAVPESSRNAALLANHFHLTPQSYGLIVTRLEPENNVLLACEAWASAPSPLQLAVVGWASYRSRYVTQLHRYANGRIHFLGPIYDPGVLQELRCNSRIYIHGCEVGGTNPALIQAMASGCEVAALDNPFNREVLGEDGLYYQKTSRSLLGVIQEAIRDGQSSVRRRAVARDRALRLYCWEAVADAYELEFRRVQLTRPFGSATRKAT